MKKMGWITFVLTLLASSFSQAQNMSVTNNSSLALDCYNRSVQAVSRKDARFADIETCDRAIDEPNLSEKDLLATLVNRGVLYATLGRIDRATRDYNQALEIAADVPEIYLNRGNLWFLAENWGEAIKDYNQAEAAGILQRQVLYLNRGMAYENSGEYDLAETDYLAAQELAPGWQPVIDKLQRLADKRFEQTTQIPAQPLLR